MILSDVLSRYPKPDSKRILQDFQAAYHQQSEAVIVLDDDPTGIQTVHGVWVYTDCSKASILDGMQTSDLFYLLTNSRGLCAEDAANLNQTIAKAVLDVQQQTHRGFLLVSRSDSTLRGHYPLETDVLRATIEHHSAIRFDGEILCPFFAEGGRYTVDDTHYVQIDGQLIPANQTEFAQDKTFPFQHAFLPEWIAEKTKGAVKAEDVISVPIQMLRAANGARQVAQLLSLCTGYRRIVVNALCYEDLMVFCTGLFYALGSGKHFLFRTASSFPKVLGAITDRPLLTRQEMLPAAKTTGGLIIAGSHVKRTSQQLAALGQIESLQQIEFHQQLALHPDAFARELRRVKGECYHALAAGMDTVIYTSRKRVDLNNGNPEDELRLARTISAAITDIVRSLTVRPAYLIAKGGITSSDIGVTGLQVQKALVQGCVLPGIPVWKTGPESRFPGLSYIIFPGNVGDENGLLDIVTRLR